MATAAPTLNQTLTSDSLSSRGQSKWAVGQQVQV